MVGLNNLSTSVAPLQLVEMVNTLYAQIDDAAEQFGVEKIKTVDDSYIAASGIHNDSDTPEAMIEFALRLADIAGAFSRDSGLDLQVRIGIGYGHVISGVIGKTRKSFELWGETVKLASSLDATCEPGRIQVTESL